VSRNILAHNIENRAFLVPAALTSANHASLTKHDNRCWAEVYGLRLASMQPEKMFEWYWWSSATA